MSHDRPMQLGLTLFAPNWAIDFKNESNKDSSKHEKDFGDSSF